jgi:hypothetical protein
MQAIQSNSIAMSVLVKIDRVGKPIDPDAYKTNFWLPTLQLVCVNIHTEIGIKILKQT